MGILLKLFFQVVGILQLNFQFIESWEREPCGNGGIEMEIKNPTFLVPSMVDIDSIDWEIADLNFRVL